MLQLIRADLTGTLALFAEYRPQLDRSSLELDIKRLKRCEDRDYLFLARREKSYLFPVSEIYTADSYAYLCWTGYIARPGPHVDAMYFHISRTANGWPFGTVTVLDYEAAAKDVEKFSTLPPQALQAHIQKTVNHYQHHTQICSEKDFIEHLRKAGDTEWM